MKIRHTLLFASVSFLYFVAFPTVVSAQMADSIPKTIRASTLDGAHIAKARRATIAEVTRVKEPSENGNMPEHGRRDGDMGKYKEGDMVSLTGWVRSIALRPDGDYFIELADAREGGNVMIAEIPWPDSNCVESAKLRTILQNCRDQITKKMLGGKPPSEIPTRISQSTRVTLTGQLYYDNQRREGVKDVSGKPEQVSLWERHPVTAFKLAGS